MTPEREAQMREMYEKWAREQSYPIYDLVVAHGPTSSMPGTRERFSELAWKGFLACARALEPFAVDAYDLGWLSCVEWSDRDDLAADMQSPAYLNQRNLRLKALAEKPNAAMSAALEDGHANQ